MADLPACIWCGHREEQLRSVNFRGHELTLCQRHAEHLGKVLGSGKTATDFMVKGLSRIVEKRDGV